MTDAYVRTTYQGHTVNRRTAALLEVANERLGEDEPMTMTQGSYNTSVAASAGTHAGGGAFDLTAFNWRRRVRVLRRLGVAAWHRPYNWDNRGGSEHIHCIVSGDKELSPAARAQIQQYKDHTNGLASHAYDDFPFHPDLEPFNYPAWLKEQRRSRRFVRAVTGSIKKLVQARKNAPGEVLRKGLTRTISHLRKVRATQTK